MLSQKYVEAVAKQTVIAHRSQYAALKDRWLGLVGRYENKLREKSISADTESKVALGAAYSLVENAIPRIFNKQPKYKYLGREGKDGAEAEVYNEFSDYQWDEAGAKAKCKDIARWGLATGLAGWKMGWKEERTLVRKNGKEVLGVHITNPMLMELSEKIGVGKSVKIDEEKTVSNYTLHPIKPFDLIWNTDALDMDGIRVFGHKLRKSIRDLKAQGYDTRNLVSQVKDTEEWARKIHQQDGITPYQLNQLAKDEQVDVYELYTRLKNEEGIMEYHIVTLAGTETGEPSTIRFDKNPLDYQFIPMGIFRPVDRLGKFYGFGLIEPVTGVLDAEEDTLNMAMEAFWTDVSKPMEYNPQNLLDIKSLEYRPRTLVPVRKLGESTSIMPTPQVDMGGVNLMTQYLQRAKQNITGLTDYQTAADQVTGGKTLGEVRIKTQESNARIAMIAEQFETQVLEPIGKMALWMNKQYLADTKKKYYYRIIGKKGAFLEKSLKSKDIQAVKDIVVVSGSSMLVDQVAEYQKWTALLNQSYLEAKQPQPVPINRETIWERLLEQGTLITDIESFLPNAKEREEQEVGGDMAQIEDAKEENAKPFTARVLPTDNHQVHLKLHKPEADVRMQEVDANPDPRKIEELQALTQHINSHVQAAGGQNPQFTEQMQVGQGMEPLMQPNAGQNQGQAGGEILPQ